MLGADLFVRRHGRSVVNTSFTRTDAPVATVRGAWVERVAVITDIHGNLPALEAALARIEELGIERVFCGGDLVGYGPHPNEVCALIEERAIPTIYGNYDHAIARDHDDCGCAYVTQHDRDLGQQSVAWTLEHTYAGRKGLHARPPVRPALRPSARSASTSSTARPERSTSTSSRTSPPRCTSASRRPRRTTSSSSATRTSRGCAEFGGVLFVNCGSVGKPKDGDPRGAFAVLEPRGDGLDVTIERVAYDADAVAAEVRAAGLPEEYADKLLLAA